MGTLRAIFTVLAVLSAILLTGVGAMIFYKVRAAYTDELITTGVVVSAYGYGGGIALIFLALALRWIKKNLGGK